MTVQRLYKQVTGTVNASGIVTMSFEPVPSSQVWTGSVALFAPPALVQTFPPTGPPYNLANGPLAGAMWFLTRNQSPLVQMGGACVAHDVQLVGQEVLTVQGWGLTPGDVITATWTGYGDDASTAPILYPRVYATPDPYVAVYNGNGPSGPLDVVTVPDPSRTVAVATGALTSATVQTLIPASATGHIRLLSFSLNISAATQSTAAEEAPIVGMIQFNDGTTITPIAQAEAIVVQASTVAVAESQELHELPVLSNQRVELATTTFSGTGSHHVNATVVYSFVPLAP